MTTLNIKGFPDGLYDRLREHARQERRSIAQQVIFLLENALPDGGRSLLELRGLGGDHWRGIDPAAHVAEERRSWDS